MSKTKQYLFSKIYYFRKEYDIQTDIIIYLLSIFIVCFVILSTTLWEYFGSGPKNIFPTQQFEIRFLTIIFKEKSITAVQKIDKVW